MTIMMIYMELGSQSYVQVYNHISIKSDSLKSLFSLIYRIKKLLDAWIEKLVIFEWLFDGVFIKLHFIHD